MGSRARLKKEEIASLIYHSQFDYPMTVFDLARWKAGLKYKFKNPKPKTSLKFKDGYFYHRNASLIFQRLQKEKYSRKKLGIARKAVSVLKIIPTVKFVGVTGSLAMMNADKASDIDLMIITSRGMLWTTRAVSLVVLPLLGFKLRRAGDKNEKDKLCLNLWLDESDLEWEEKNEFTAHEIAQVMPLVNKDNMYERFLWENKWILDYWPKAVKIMKPTGFNPAGSDPTGFFEKLAFKLQYLYMKKKITNEVVAPTRAQFHPRRLTA